MILVIASKQDWAARGLLARWAAHGARLVTPSDLSLPGWCYRLGDIAASHLVADGEVLESGAVTGVLSRLPAVTPHDLVHIAATDRAYVAAEMNAALLAWLTELPCPVLNRPAPFCLVGPAWRHERWIHVAAQLGIPVIPARRSTTALTPVWAEAGGITVTVVGHRSLGEVDPILREQARQLAQAAGVEMLAVRFDGAGAGAHVMGADPSPPIVTDELADAILAHLREGNQACLLEPVSL